MEIKEVTSFTTVNSLCKEWNSLFLILGQLCDRCLKPQRGNVSPGNGGKSLLLLLNGSDVSDALEMFPTELGACILRGNATNPLGTHLGEGFSSHWDEFVKSCKQMCAEMSCTLSRVRTAHLSAGRVQRQREIHSHQTPLRWGDGHCETQKQKGDYVWQEPAGWSFCREELRGNVGI